MGPDSGHVNHAQRCRGSCGMDVAKELTFTGRVLSASEAMQLGLRHLGGRRPPRGRPRARRRDRLSLPRTRCAPPSGCSRSHGPARPEETLALEAELQRGLIGSPNQLAAVTAGFTKEPAEFVD